MHAAEIWVDDHYVPGKDDEPPESIEAEVRADAEWVAKAAEEVRALTGGRPPPDPGPSFGGTAPIQPLPEVRVRGGTPFELGQQVGERMRLFIADSFETDRRLKQLITHCESTEEGRKLLRDFEEANRAAYPAVLEEIDGIVAGSGLSQTAVLIANFRQEIVAFVPDTDPIVGCTDLHVAAPWCAAWGHSEDATSPAIDELPLGYIVHSTLLDDDETTILHHYTAFAYPGCVCGWAWGFNSHGVVCSINALTPAKLQVGLAASVVSRDVLNATGLDDAKRRATVGGHGGGQRFNIRSTHEPHKRLLVATSPSGCIVKELVGNDGCDESDWTAPPAESVFCGCNVYLFGDVGALEGRTAQFGESSRRRLLRAQQLIRGLGGDLESGASLAWILKGTEGLYYRDG